MAQHTTRPTLVKAVERRLFVLSLRRAGAHYRDIAATTIAHFGAERLPKNYDHRIACSDVMIELKRIAAETSVEARILRAQEIDRYNRMLAAIWRQVADGHLGAIDRAIRISERRSKLLGLDMPTRVDYTDVLEEEIERLAEEWLAGQLAAARESESDAGSGSEDGAGDAPEVA